MIVNKVIYSVSSGAVENILGEYLSTGNVFVGTNNLKIADKLIYLMFCTLYSIYDNKYRA